MPRPKKNAPAKAEPAKPAPKAPAKVEPPKAPPPPPPPSNIVTNCVRATRLHLGDGRVLAFGESGEVSDATAAFLRERGQAS